ncbi:MAG: L,D-transpeptidase [Paracoccaceae bacterium]
MLRPILALAALLALSACARGAEPEGPVELPTLPEYRAFVDDGFQIPPVPGRLTAGVNRREVVDYFGDEPPGTIEVDRHAKFLYWVMPEGRAVRYPIAVGRLGRAISGDTVIRRKAEWPGWTPTPNMLRTEPEVYGDFADGIPGGLRSPLGARALYMFRDGRDTFYRIHGTNDLESIGNSGSAGCIRMFNQDVIDLYERVPTGTRVTMRSYEDSLRLEGPALANRGRELPPRILDPEAIYGEAAVAADRRIDAPDGFVEPVAAPEPERRGLFGRLFGRGGAEAAAEAPARAPAPVAPQVAALPPLEALPPPSRRVSVQAPAPIATSAGVLGSDVPRGPLVPGGTALDGL